MFAVDINSTGVNTLILVAAAIGIGFFTLVRGRSDVWKSNYEAEKARGDDLQKEIAKLKITVIELQAQITTLQSQPNLDKLFELMVKHDKNVAIQSNKITGLLDKISKKLS